MTETLNINDSTVNNAGNNMYNIGRDNVYVNAKEVRRITNIVFVVQSPNSTSPSRSMWAGVVTLGSRYYGDIKSVILITFRKLGEWISSCVICILIACPAFLTLILGGERFVVAIRLRVSASTTSTGNAYLTACNSLGITGGLSSVYSVYLKWNVVRRAKWKIFCRPEIKEQVRTCRVSARYWRH
jgi:hypothetical protein